jgi:hypothetical protein
MVDMMTAARTGALAEADTAQTLVRSAKAAQVIRACDARGLLALLVYLALSSVFFGRVLFGRFSTFCIGTGPDPRAMMWFLMWWPHALAHGLDPFLTKAIWAPHGINLAWLTTMPLVALLASPVTELLSPIASYNILCLLSLPFNAWCAFIACRYLTRDCWSSMLGGYIFGFSPFMLSHLAYGHLIVLLAFPIPLTVYIVALHFAGEIAESKFVVLLTLLLVAEFLTSLEIFATMTAFGGLALFLGWHLSRNGARQRASALITPIICSYAITLLLVSPYLYYFVAFGFTTAPLFPPSSFSTDLLNFIIPTPANEVGRVPSLVSISNRFLGGWASESGAYLSFPLIVVAILYLHRHWREPLGRILVDSLVIIIAVSLGPALHVGGKELELALPWKLVVQFPVLNDALPGRLVIFAFLVLAIIVSSWFATANVRPAVKLGIAFAIVALGAPNLSASFWGSTANVPAFFRNGLYRRYLYKDETILVLPYGYTGDSMLWQAASHMYFAMAEGYGGTRPQEFQKWPIVDGFLKRTYVPSPVEQLRAFLAAHGVRIIVATDGVLTTWQGLLSSVATAPIRVGGIWLYETQPVKGSEVSAGEMRMRFDVERFAALVEAVEKYQSDGRSLASLSVLKATQLGLIPEGLMIGPPAAIDIGAPAAPNLITDPHVAYGVYLSEMPGDRVGVGVYAWDDGAAPLIEKLRGVASEIYFPHPSRMTSSTMPHAAKGWLVMVFTREQLARAAALLKTLPVPELQPQPTDLGRIRSSAAPPSVFP